MEIRPNIVDKIEIAKRDRPGVAVTSPAPRAVWSDIVAADPDGLAFQTPEWIDALCAGGAYRDASRMYEFADGQTAVLPMVCSIGLPAALSYQASMPASWGMGGLAVRGKLETKHVTAVLADLVRSPALRTSIRINPLHQKTWEAACPPQVWVKPMLAHVLDLSGGFERVWKERFTGETRTAVRKAERAGLVVELDTSGRLIPAFYQLFELSVARWAGMQNEPLALARWRAHRRDPVQKFQAIARAIGTAFRLWMAWKDGQPAAAILVLLGKNASYTRGAMDVDLAGPARANQLLHRLAIEDACQAGCRYYHMGETGESSSLAQFKSRFGAAAVPYGEYWIEKLPISRVERGLRGAVKMAIGFKDAS